MAQICLNLFDFYIALRTGNLQSTMIREEQFRTRKNMVNMCRIFFTEQFQSNVKQGISAFTGEPRPMNDPITESEVQHAMNRLNNNQASGCDELPGELLKYGSNVIAKPIANIFNRSVTDQHTLSQIGHGIIILLPKSGKPVRAMTSLRPIVRINALHKTLVLIVLSRIADEVDSFLYPRQSVMWLPLASRENSTFSDIASRTGYRYESCVRYYQTREAVDSS